MAERPLDGCITSIRKRNGFDIFLWFQNIGSRFSSTSSFISDTGSIEITVKQHEDRQGTYRNIHKTTIVLSQSTRVTDKQTVERTDHYDTQDRASIFVSRSKKPMSSKLVEIVEQSAFHRSLGRELVCFI